MYAAALSVSDATTATLGVPFFQLGSLDVGIPIQAFGVIVAAGVLIGASLMRRYSEWHGVSDEHIRGLTGWITVTGFLGAHIFDVVAYQWDKFMKDPILMLKVWDGISSYGGFLGGAMGFALYVWWKRLPVRLMADMALVGLLPAFSLGRIGCTVVSDHVGGAVDPSKWYAALAMDYPRTLNMEAVQQMVAEAGRTGNILVDYVTQRFIPIKLWNLGLIELLYLIPVNILVLWLAFRSTKRPPSGLIVVLSGVLYAPVRFFLDYLRPENSDPRHLGLTFAQWASILAFGASVYAASRILKGGKPAETVTKTSREAQERLRVILKDDEEKEKDQKDKGKKSKAKDEPAKPRPLSEPEDEDDEKDVAANKADGLKKSDDKQPTEVPPTEPWLDALPKDIIKKVEDSKAAKAIDEKAEQVEAKPEPPADDKEVAKAGESAPPAATKSAGNKPGQGKGQQGKPKNKKK